MKEIRAEIKLEELLEYLREGLDCKAEIDEDGEVRILRMEAAGYQDSISVQVFEAYDLEECESEKQYADWLESNFMHEIELEDYVLKLELVK